MEERHPLLIGVHVVGVVLREVVELLAVLIHTAQTLLQVQELLKLVSYQARGDVMFMKSCAELSPRHLVAILNSGSEISPPSTRGFIKLLGHEKGLLELSVVQKPKLGLDDVKPVIHIPWISQLIKHQRVHHQEVGVGSLHPWLAVGWAHLTLHKILHQHPHELVLRGQQLLEAHRWRRWWWWWGSPTSNIVKLIHCCHSMSV
jgi:hypothetical protein